ncbi:xylulokinase [Anaerolineae bacterium CFX9]|nr:xylulokinase [Anaerolineae bacterium CFX9]
MTSLLGIDIGTSSAKAVLFDPESAEIIAVAGHEYPVHKPAPDRAEQNPDDWWRAAQIVTRRVIQDSGRDDIAAISLSGQMHGVTLLDKKGKPAAPSIIWADQRSAAQVERLIELIGEHTYTHIAGTMPAAGFACATLLWLSEHEPALIRRARHTVLPKDYVRFQMTGEISTDVSDAAATGMFDVSLKMWSAEIVRGANLPRHLLPVVHESTAVTGTLTDSAAQALGLRAGIPVIAGCADQPAQAIANGIIDPGTTSVTVGSGGQVFTPVIPRMNGTTMLATDPRLHVFNHAVPGTWYILGATLSAGLSLRWLRGVTGLNGSSDAYATFSAEASAVSPGSDGLLFLPYLSGERTPYMDAAARGAFIGLTAFHERGHLARAVMEGVAFSLRQALEITRELGGETDTVIAAGGAMESPVWRQIMADVLGLPLRRTGMREHAALGAALLAGVGAGMFTSMDEACERAVRYGDVTDPQPDSQAIYDALYPQFQALYPRLRDDFHALSHR